MATRATRISCWIGVVLGTAFVATPARGTWSIVLVDDETNEIAIGSATCITGFDLKRWLPVVRVGKGAAAAQALVDTFHVTRPIIYDELGNQTDPAVILAILEAEDLNHQRRQYGIADTLGRAVTFTGSLTSAWANGVTGQQGTMIYAIQGNILTGQPVIDAAEQAVLNTVGDLPAKLMAGMQAARSMGGDGRCSCSEADPTGCGSPPPSFDKAAHVGFMIVSRTGDTDGGCTGAAGCAAGDYFMALNVSFQTESDPDPVLQLQQLFDAWRTSLIGRPDAVQSGVTFNPPSIPANGTSTTTMTITLIDWQGNQLPGSVSGVTVVHEEGSAGESTIGPVQDNGDGTYTVVLTAGTNPGIDRFRVTADDGIRPVVLMPPPELQLTQPIPGDLDGDGDVDLSDFSLFAQCFAGADNPPAADCPPGIDADLDGDGDVDLTDFSVFAQNFTGAM